MQILILFSPIFIGASFCFEYLEFILNRKLGDETRCKNFFHTKNFGANFAIKFKKISSINPNLVTSETNMEPDVNQYLTKL